MVQVEVCSICFKHGFPAVTQQLLSGSHRNGHEVVGIGMQPAQPQMESYRHAQFRLVGRVPHGGNDYRSADITGTFL